MYKCSYGIGEIIGPLISGALYDMFSFRTSCDVIGLILIASCIVFYACVPKIKPLDKEKDIEEIEQLII